MTMRTAISWQICTRSHTHRCEADQSTVQRSKKESLLKAINLKWRERSETFPFSDIAPYLVKHTCVRGRRQPSRVRCHRGGSHAPTALGWHNRGWAMARSVPWPAGHPSQRLHGGEDL
jgi:hypothetical protein